MSRVLLVSIAVITGIYLLLNWAYLQGIGLAGMTNSDAIAANLMGRAMGEPGLIFISLLDENDVVYDLGSGDGRIPIMAAQEYGARGIGIEIDPERIQEARQNAQEEGVTDHVEFIQQDLFETNLSEATVVTLYLLPSLNVKLRPKLLKELEPGTPIVSHDFNMGDWEPERVVEVKGSTVYLWTVPEEIPENLL